MQHNSRSSGPNGVPDNCLPEVTAAPAQQMSIYVAGHCATCIYSYEVAEFIRTHFPDVDLRVIDIETAEEAIPEAVFATPTYLLNGSVWSLGNPSMQKVTETFQIA
jgi:hypothetical protein